MAVRKCKKCGKVLTYGKTNLCEACINKKINKGKIVVKTVLPVVLTVLGSTIGIKKIKK